MVKKVTHTLLRATNGPTVNLHPAEPTKPTKEKPISKTHHKIITSHFTAHTPAQTKPEFYLETKNFPQLNRFPQGINSQINPKINPKNIKVVGFHLPMENLASKGRGTGKNHRKKLLGTSPAGPAASSAQSGGRPTDWVPKFFLPSLTRPTSTHTRLPLSWCKEKMKKNKQRRKKKRGRKRRRKEKKYIYIT